MQIIEQAELTGKYPILAKAFSGSPEGFPTNLATRHERVAMDLDGVWGTANCVKLLDDLVFSDRPDRLGFTYDVMMELFALKNHHDRLYPQFSGSQHDPFLAVKVIEPKRAEATATVKVAEPKAVTATPRAVIEDAPPTVPAATNPSAAWPELSSLDELRFI